MSNKKLLISLFVILIIISFIPNNYTITNIKEIPYESDKSDKLTNSEDIEGFEITQSDRDKLYFLLKTITDLLDKEGIIYWIDGGTILGSVRHGKLVPWDDDIDICILSDDFDKLKMIGDYVKPLGFEIIKHWHLYKFRYIDQEYPFIDIFLNIKKANTYTLDHPELNNTWPNEYFSQEELFPLKKYKFGENYYTGPNYPLEYLSRMYPLWEFIGIQSYDHKANKKINEKVILNTSDEKLELKPYYYVKNEENPSNIYDEKFNDYVIIVLDKDKVINLEKELKINLNV